MNYEDAFVAMVSRARARAEIERHNCDFALFLEEVGTALSTSAPRF